MDGLATPTSNRWRTIREFDVVVSYYVAVNGVGLFVRGLRDADSSEVRARLEPYGERLSDALGAELGEPEDEYFFGQSLDADTSDHSRWDELADWLNERVELYATSLRALG